LEFQISWLVPLSSRMALYGEREEKGKGKRFVSLEIMIFCHLSSAKIMLWLRAG